MHNASPAADAVLSRILGDLPVRCGVCGAAGVAGTFVREHRWCDGTALSELLLDAHADGGTCRGVSPCSTTECILGEVIGPWVKHDTAWRGDTFTFLVERWLPFIKRRRKAFWADLAFKTMARHIGKTLFDVWMEVIIGCDRTTAIDVHEIKSVIRATGCDPERFRRLIRATIVDTMDLGGCMREIGYRDLGRIADNEWPS